MAEGDFFAPVPASLSGKRSGLVDAIAVRVSFVGETRALREFLHDLGEGTLPAHICSVDVEPAVEAVELPGHVDRTAFTPFVTSRHSQFTVTLEWLEVPIALPAHAAASEALTASSR